MTKKTLSNAELISFTGTERLFRHGLKRNILYTEGVQYIAEHGGAYWLIDEIALKQSDPTVASEAFQFWCLAVSANKTATLTCEDGNGQMVFTKQIEFTDFPLDEIYFYFTNNTILLPSEY